MAISHGQLETIGHTPAVRLRNLVRPDMAEVVVKLEANNPTGSYKDRMALAMIEGAERSGRLRPGQTVVEYTGGSTGSSLAFVCAIKGYPLRIVSSDAFAEEKALTMRAFGAQVELLDSPEGITPGLIPRMMARAREIVAEAGGYATDQFNNRDMIEGYLGLGRELADQVEGRLDAFCTYIGTAGCFIGTSRDSHGPPGCPRGRHLGRPVHPGEPRGRPAPGRAPRTRSPRRDAPGGQRPEVPRRRHLPLTPPPPRVSRAQPPAALAWPMMPSNSSIVKARIVTVRPKPRAPLSRMPAVTASSLGASLIDTKAYWPRVPYVPTTRPPPP